MFKKKNTRNLIVGLSLILTLAFSASAQAKRKTVKKKTVKKTSTTQTKPVETEVVEVKKNARPENESSETRTTETAKTNARPTNAAKENNSVYFYEFAQPKFTVSKLNIEHDENGKGKITILKKDFSEPETDPLQLSAAALERVKAAWRALDFLNSTENYQYEKDFSHLGTMTFTMKKNGKTREAKFNWTDNKDAKTLTDEYRKIGQQFVWIFDINVARENQPLEAPSLLDALDSLIRRNEISDAEQMIPFLNELNNDERIPLIARNHAAKLVKQIEKKK